MKNKNIKKEKRGGKPEEVLDDHWRDLMMAGNAAGRAGAFDEALAHYLDGIKEAKRLFQLSRAQAPLNDSDPAPALVVASRNAAFMFSRQENHQRAKAVMNDVMALFSEAITDETTSLDLRMSCLQHINRAAAYLIEHMRALGDSDAEIARTVKTLQKTTDPSRMMMAQS
ncbi:MAG: hypothetical protein AAGD92_06720 [Pseudomonadota bacterium]